MLIHARFRACRRIGLARVGALTLAGLCADPTVLERSGLAPPSSPFGLSITTVRVTPERPGPGSLCQLSVTIANAGTTPASRFRFAVKIDGRPVAAYTAAMHLDVVAPRATKQIQLYNFWSRKDADASGMQVEVSLASAEWVQSGVAADGVRTWSATGRVTNLPSTSQMLVRVEPARGPGEAAGASPATSSADAEAETHRERFFRDVTVESGMQFTHERATFDPRLAHIMTWVTSIHAGACAADYDRDGDLDFYILTSKEGAPNALFRNEGNGRFVDVAASSRVADLNNAEGLSMTCLFADVNNDGYQDLLVGSYGRTRLLHGDAAGRFTEVGNAAGLTETGNVSAAVFFDYDADGWLDLLVGRYFEQDMRRLTSLAALPTTFHSARNGAPNLLYRNNGNGSFTEVGGALGVNDRGWTLAAAAGDLDNDGDSDVYIANDFGPDVVYRNNGDGSFSDVSDDAIGPDSDAGMNAEMGDINGDGLLDLYVTNITNPVMDQGNMLWKNLGKLQFVNLAQAMNVRDGGWGWAAKFLDFDNDGDLDIYTVNGFVSDGPMDIFRRPGQIVRGNVSDIRSWPDMRGLSLSGYEKNLLFRNDGDEFVEIGAAAGVDALADGRGIAAGDIEGDGDVDMLVTNIGAPPLLYRNDIGQKYSWFAAELVGTAGNRDAIGARVTVTTGDRRQIREVDGGSGYNAQGSRVVHVGLGQATTADHVEVRWPGGRRVRHLALPARTKAVIAEEDSP